VAGLGCPRPWPCSPWSCWPCWSCWSWSPWSWPALITVVVAGVVTVVVAGVVTVVVAGVVTVVVPALITVAGLVVAGVTGSGRGSRVSRRPRPGRSRARGRARARGRGGVIVRAAGRGALRPSRRRPAWCPRSSWPRRGPLPSTPWPSPRHRPRRPVETRTAAATGRPRPGPRRPRPGRSSSGATRAGCAGTECGESFGNKAARRGRRHADHDGLGGEGGLLEATAWCPCPSWPRRSRRADRRPGPSTTPGRAGPRWPRRRREMAAKRPLISRTPRPERWSGPGRILPVCA
jgi:hypothetical protein